MISSILYDIKYSSLILIIWLYDIMYIIWYQVFLFNTNNLQTDVLDP